MTHAPAGEERYVAAFDERCDVMWRPGRPRVDEPGVRGLLASSDEPVTRLLVTDDRAFAVLAALLPAARGGVINVFARAARCAGLLDRDPAWTSKAVTAMVCRDLQSVPAVALPGELTLRPVRRLAGDARDGVPLEAAVALARLADPTTDDALGSVVASLPPAIRLFAAVDAAGTVRATSGSGAFGTAAGVLFVNTHPRWRGRGIGTAMTAAALRAARDSGAGQACLDASDIAVPVYLRLGFEAVTRTTHYVRAG